jgi:hypothetical protein
MHGEYPPKVLQRSRKIATATASGLPVTVGSASQATITIPFTGVLSDLTQLHSRIKVSMFNSKLTTDAGGATFINIESANIQDGSQRVSQPLFTGSALGAYNGAALQGALDYDTDDFTGSLGAPPSAIFVVIVVNNSDSSGHQVTGATASIAIEGTQYDDLFLATEPA